MQDRIGFSTANGLISKIIRWFTQASVSHSWLLYYDVDFGRDMVLEATLEGVRIIPLDVFKKHNKIVKIASPSKDLRIGLVRAGEILGESYDFTGLFGMLLVLLGRWLKKKWQNPGNSAHSLFCSELVAKILVWSDYPGTDYWDASTMTPQDLYEFFIKQEVKEATLNAARNRV